VLNIFSVDYVFIRCFQGEKIEIVKELRVHVKRVATLQRVGKKTVWSSGDDGKVVIWNVSTFRVEHNWVPFVEGNNASSASVKSIGPRDAIQQQVWQSLNASTSVWIGCPVQGKLFVYQAKVRGIFCR
jgi:hypothetical protein